MNRNDLNEMNTMGALALALETAIPKLGERDREFATSMLTGFERFGRFTPKMLPWVHKLIERAERPDAGTENIGGADLIAFMDRAADAGLKYPKVKLTADGEPLVISRAGSRSKAPGALNITDGGPFGDNVWYGRIDRDGTFTPGRACTDSVRKVLKALARDPARTAAAYGKRTGNCCFCRRDLEDYRSVSVGYGPVCAEKWGLPWGEVHGNPSEYRECTPEEYRAARDGEENIVTGIRKEMEAAGHGGAR